MIRFAHLATAAGLVAGSLLSTGAYAQDASDAAPTAVLSTSGVDLTSAAGHDEMMQRIVRVADQVCDAGDSRDLAAMSAASACRSKAIANASSQLDVAVAQARSATRVASATPTTNAVN